MKKTFYALCIALVVSFLSVIGADPLARNEFITLITDSVDRGLTYVGEHITGQQAAVFFVPGISSSELRNIYALAGSTDQSSKGLSFIGNTVTSTPRKVKILIMPGHEPEFGGAEYSGSGADIKERELNVELANDLAALFKNNPHYEVVVPRDNDAWSPEFATYFKEHWNDIKNFTKNQHDEMMRLVKKGKIKLVSPAVIHNDAPTDVALRIYGINKWASEHGVGMVIHIHFNDYPRYNMNTPGDYSGFTIYVPEKQYSNSSTTREIADAVEKRLSKYVPMSDMPQEKQGIVEDQDLIAIGARNTSDAPSMLVEYGYIYQSELQNPVTRKLTLEDMAFQTYLGVQDFFGSGNDVTMTYDNLVLPHTWKKMLSKLTGTSGKLTDQDREDIFALQTALMYEGVYPPTGSTKNDCPRTGVFGPCTSTAVAQFQKKYNIIGERGYVGEKTRTRLNELHALQAM